MADGARTELYVFWVDPFAGRLEGQVAGALERAESGGAVRIAEALVVGREPGTGAPLVLRASGGTAGLLPTLTTLRLGHRAGAPDPPGERHGEADSDDVRALLELVPPGAAVVALRIEHRWAQVLDDAVQRTGGRLLLHDLAEHEPHEDVATLTAELVRREVAHTPGRPAAPR